VTEATHSTRQEGIYFRSGERPPGFFALALLHVPKDQRESVYTLGRVRFLLAQLWARLADLKVGLVADLPGIKVPDGDLQVLLGFGCPAFDLVGAHAPPARFVHPFDAVRPEGTLFADGSAGIRYASDLDKRSSDVEFALQFTAETPLAVERAVVETARFLRETKRATGRPSPLELSAVYTGTQRDDGRSWIDFHDGLSNLRARERPGVIFISAAPDDEAWTINGTYLAFLRLGINLDVWHGLPREVQERVVGRDKVSGCPLLLQDDGSAVPVSGCPVAGLPITAGDNPFREARRWPGDRTPLSKDTLSSHVHRANQGITPPDDPASLRIFRQGYPFFESVPGADSQAFRVGLNFVSFQSSPERFTQILQRVTWLGDTNFGGTDEIEEENPLITAYAAGMFFVPPRAAGEKFPGASALRFHEATSVRASERRLVPPLASPS
jgi:Dyp-type peroxidase family